MHFLSSVYTRACAHRSVTVAPHSTAMEFSSPHAFSSFTLCSFGLDSSILLKLSAFCFFFQLLESSFVLLFPRIVHKFHSSESSKRSSSFLVFTTSKHARARTSSAAPVWAQQWLQPLSSHTFLVIFPQAIGHVVLSETEPTSTTVLCQDALGRICLDPCLCLFLCCLLDRIRCRQSLFP